MAEPLYDLVMEYRLRWLEHLGRMGEERLPKMLLFRKLEKKRPCHGTKRWHDRITSDLRATGIVDNWYSLAQNRSQWHTFCDKEIRKSM